MPFDFLKENVRVNQSCTALSITPTANRLIVSIPKQELAVFKNGHLTQVYSISTSKNPPSCEENSFGTPTGLHTIAQKIGSDAPEGMVFKGRTATGQHYWEATGEEAAKNLITSRIMRLRGMESGKNEGEGCDSYNRYIYIHGTNQENRIGQTFSGGCVEMLNRDIIELFEQIDEGDLVAIFK